MCRLSKPFHYLSSELAKERYETYTIRELVARAASQLAKNKVHVGFRIDVDSHLHVCPALGEELLERGINATFYFLVHPDRYYDIWRSPIPAELSEQAFEIGLHTDHFYEEIAYRGGGARESLSRLRDDIEKLSIQVDRPVDGITAHGHSEIDYTDKRNWNPYAHLSPHELKLQYHDGTLQLIEKRPDVVRIQDHLGITNGWSYWPKYPQQALRRVPSGSIVLLYVHPDTFFDIPPARRFDPVEVSKRTYWWMRIRLRHQLVSALIGEGKNARQELKNLIKEPQRLWSEKR